MRTGHGAVTNRAIWRYDTVRCVWVWYVHRAFLTWRYDIVRYRTPGGVVPVFTLRVHCPLTMKQIHYLDNEKEWDTNRRNTGQTNIRHSPPPLAVTDCTSNRCPYLRPDLQQIPYCLYYIWEVETPSPNLLHSCIYLVWHPYIYLYVCHPFNCWVQNLGPLCWVHLGWNYNGLSPLHPLLCSFVFKRCTH